VSWWPTRQTRESFEYPEAEQEDLEQEDLEEAFAQGKARALEVRAVFADRMAEIRALTKRIPPLTRRIAAVRAAATRRIYHAPWTAEEQLQATNKPLRTVLKRRQEPLVRRIQEIITELNEAIR
jgi:hypothetical protein